MTQPAGRDPVVTFAGFGLAAVGGLILGLSGLCTLATVAATAGGSLSGWTDLLGVAFFLGLFGGVPMVVGYMTLRWGRRLLREASSQPHRPAEHSANMGAEVQSGRRAEGRAARLGSYLVMAFGALLALGAAFAAATLLVTNVPQLVRERMLGGYTILFVVPAFLAGVGAICGLALVMAGRALAPPVRPPPASPPPP